MTLNVGGDDADRQPVSAPTRRVVSVIDHLADDVTARPTLADIIRATDMTRATAHAVLSQLCADGWTVRDDSGRFSLAPRFLARIRHAAGAQPLAGAARPVLADLHRRLGLPVFLSERDGEFIQITEVAGDIGWAAPGTRLPVTAPLCREYIAWADGREQTAWLSTAPPPSRNRLASLLTVIRDRGYSVERLGPEATEVMATLRAVHLTDASQPVRRRLADLLVDLMTSDYRPEDLDGDVRAMSVAAPVRTTADRVANNRVMSSIVACPGDSLGGSALAALVGELQAAAGEIERALLG